jgi:hypothetical protein
MKVTYFEPSRLLRNYYKQKINKLIDFYYRTYKTKAKILSVDEMGNITYEINEKDIPNIINKDLSDATNGCFFNINQGKLK